MTVTFLAVQIAVHTYVQRDSSLRCRNSCLCCHIRGRAVEALKRQVNCAQSTDTGSHVVWYAVSVHDELLAGSIRPDYQICMTQNGIHVLRSASIPKSSGMCDCDSYG